MDGETSVQSSYGNQRRQEAKRQRGEEGRMTERRTQRRKRNRKHIIISHQHGRAAAAPDDPSPHNEPNPYSPGLQLCGV